MSNGRQIFYYRQHGSSLGACCAGCASGGRCHGLDGLAGFAPDDLASLAAAAGFGSSLDTAVAVALAESSGNPNAYNPETAAGTPAGKGSYGLWQIYLKAHPEFAGMDLYDPMINATAAFSVSNGGTNFRPWTTYKNGRYRDFLGLVSSTAPPTPTNTGDDSGAINSPATVETPSSPAFFGVSGMTLAALGIGAYLLLK